MNPQKTTRYPSSLYINEEALTIIAGPCVVESLQMLHDIAGTMQEVTRTFGFTYIFKASYKKANRTSLSSFTGIGDIQALEYLSEIQSHYQIPIITDVHTVQEAQIASEFVDILQIPAFLFRQTDLLLAAGQTGKTVSIKKGQFAAPDDMKAAVDKVRSTSMNDVWVCERGTTFGYHDLVVDMRSLVAMRNCHCPVIYDATHSVQKPSLTSVSGGSPEYIPALARAAVSVGIDGLFFETHPDPTRAKSDAATQLPLSKVRVFLEQIKDIHSTVKPFAWE